MTLVSEGRVMAEGMPAELIPQVVKMQETECINAMIEKMEFERPYKIMAHRELVADRYLPGCMKSSVYIDIEPIPEVRLTYMSPEDMHLKPDKSLIEKLKNCWRYLHDRSNGQYVMEKQGE